VAPFSAEIPDDDWIGAGRQEVLVPATQDLEPIALRIEVWDGDPGGIRPDAFRLPAAGDYDARLSISLPEESEETTESVVARFWPVAGT
jgi:hypothetical protein